MSEQLTLSREPERTLPQLPAPKGDSYAKPQDILVIFPKTGKMTAVGRKIFNVLAASMQGQSNEYKKKNGVDMPLDILFEMPLRDMLDGIESEKSNLYQLAKTRLKEMVGTTIEYGSPTADGSKRDWGVVALIAQAEIEHRDGIPIVLWQYPKKVRDALTQNGLYATLNNAIISGLKTYAAVALYENAVKFKTNQSGVTARHDVKFWIDTLSESAPKINRKTGKALARDWADFKRRQLKLAMEEINAKTDIVIDLLEYKTGKKVTQAQFAVKRKANPEIDATVELSSTIKFEAVQAGLHNSDVLTLMKLGNSEELLVMCIRKLQERMNDTSQAKVASRINYLRSIVSSAGGTVQKRAEPKTRVATKNDASASSTPQVASPPEIQILGPDKSTSRAPLPLAKTYREERFEEIKQMVLELQVDVQREIANAAYAELSPVLARTSIRKLQAGEWSTFIPLMSKMVELYAAKTYGPNWDAEQQVAQ